MSNVHEDRLMAAVDELVGTRTLGDMDPRSDPKSELAEDKLTDEEWCRREAIGDAMQRQYEEQLAESYGVHGDRDDDRDLERDDYLGPEL